MNRRNFGRATAGLGLASLLPLGICGSPAMALDRKPSPNEKSPAELVTPAAKKSIDRGLNFLIRNQVKAGRNRGAFGNNGISSGVATASLGGLAMMCAGHAPGQGSIWQSNRHVHRVRAVQKRSRHRLYLQAR